MSPAAPPSLAPLPSTTNATSPSSTTAAARAASLPTDQPRQGAERSDQARRSERLGRAAVTLARADPAAYAHLVFGLPPAPHHRAWLARLQEALLDPAGGARLVLVAPPGSAKSTLWSLVVPCWYLGRFPGRSILAVVASDAMAAQFRLVVAETLEGNAVHRAVFPAEESRPAPDKGWSSDGLYLRGTPTKDPAYRCVGRHTKVVGSRCHLLLLDDVVDQETAESEVEMARTRRDLDRTIIPRLHPDGVGLAVGTRWAEADGIAHLAATGWDVEVWPQLHATYPGAAEQRDAEGRAPLWPAHYPLAWVQQEQARLGSAQFELLHQGNPLLIGGAVYRHASWFRPLPTDYGSRVAGGVVRVTFVDTAWSARQTADYTAAVTVAYRPDDPARSLYIVGLWRARVDQDGLAQALAQHLAAVRPHAVGVEQGAYQQAATASLVRQVGYALNNQLATAVVAVPVAVDKVTRARVPAAKGEAGALCLDRSLDLADVLIRECLALPLGAHDDLADALSGAAAMALYGVETLARGQGPLMQRGQPMKVAMR